MCFDGVKRLCHIRGKLRKKVWINQSDIILIGLRDYQDAKADVILKYTADEARNLKSYASSPSRSRSTRQSTFTVETTTTTTSSSTMWTLRMTVDLTIIWSTILTEFKFHQVYAEILRAKIKSTQKYCVPKLKVRKYLRGILSCRLIAILVCLWPIFLSMTVPHHLTFILNLKKSCTLYFASHMLVTFFKRKFVSKC